MKIYAAFPGEATDFEEVRRFARDDEVWIGVVAWIG